MAIKTLHVLCLGAFAACAAVPASAGGLLGGAGGVAASAAGSATGAVGLGGSPLGGMRGLGGGLTGSGNGVLGATLSGGGLQPGVGAAALQRPLSSGLAGGQGLGGGRAWGTFEDAKGALKGRSGSALSRASELASRPLPAPTGVLGAGRATAEAAGGRVKKSYTEGFSLSRSFALPETAPAKAQAKAGAAASGSASAHRAKVASSSTASASVQAGR